MTDVEPYAVNSGAAMPSGAASPVRSLFAGPFDVPAAVDARTPNTYCVNGFNPVMVAVVPVPGDATSVAPPSSMTTMYSVILPFGRVGASQVSVTEVAVVASAVGR